MADPTLKFNSSDDLIYKDVSANDNFVFQINGSKVATMSQADTHALKLEGSSQTTLVEIDQGSAPGTTTDKLYNVSGDLFWNGTNISQSAGGLIQDSDMNTSISTEAETDTIIFKTNGQEEMRITTDGKVGIGTNVPTGILDIQVPHPIAGDERIFIGVTAFQFDIGRGNLGLGVTNPEEQIHLERGIEFNSYPNGHPDDSVNKLYAVGGDLFWNQQAVTGSGSFIQDDVGDTTRVSTNDVAENISLKTNNVVRYNIDSDGHIIPQANDAYDLGTTGARFRDLYISGNSINMADNIHIASDGDNFKIFSGSNQRLTIDDTGKLGINSASPAHSIDASGDIRAQGGNVFLTDDDEKIASNGTDMTFFVGGAERAKIDASGNLGVGKTAAAGNKLDVAGNVQLDEGYEVQINENKVIDEFSIGTGVTSSSLQVVDTLLSLDVSGDLSVGVTSFVVQNGTGFIGINTDSPTDTLTVNGNANLTDGNAYNIDDNLIINETSIGSSVVNSALTSVGDLTSLTVTGTSNQQGVATFGNDVNINGDLNVSGVTFTIETNQVVVKDPMIKLADGNPGATFDVGFYGLVDGGVTKFSGLIKDASADKFFLFDKSDNEPGTETYSDITRAFVTVDTANDRVGLGLGVTAPSKALEVGGSALLQGGELCLVDSNEKIASDGTDLTIDVGGSQRLVIQGADGNVGIATATADEALHLNGIMKIEDAVAPGVTENKLYSVSGDLFWAGVEISQDSDSIQNTQDGADTTSITTAAVADTIILTTNSTEAARINSSGDVGIGTDAQTSRLQVEKDTTDPIVLVKPVSTNGFDSVVEIQGARRETTSADQAQLILSNYDENKSGEKLGNVGKIAAHITNDTLNVGDLVFYTYPTGQDVDETRAMTITKDGDVGLGVTAPSYKLDVDGDANLSASKDYRINGASVLNTTTLGNSVVNSMLTSVGTLTNLTVTGDLTVDTQVLKVDTSTDRVGINSANPTQALDVDGDALIQDGNLYLFDTAEKIQSDGSEMTFHVGSMERAVIDASGNVGIGTTDPDEQLEIAGNFKFNGASDQILNDDASLRLSKDTLGATVINSSLTSVGDLVDLTVDGDVDVGITTLYVDVSANSVGIGTNTPSKALDVNGDALIQGGVVCLFNNDEKIMSDGSELTFHVGNSERLVIDASGNVGIGTTDPDEKLEVNGNIKFNGASDQLLNDDASLRLSKDTLGATVINSSLQNVGVLSSLEVAGDLLVDTNTLYVDSANNQVMVGITEAATACNFQIHNASADTVLAMTNGNTGATASDGFVASISNTTSDVELENKEANANIIMKIDGDNVLYLQGSNDFVGVGKTPGYKLDVDGDANLSASQDYRINGVSVLNSSTLGSGVLASSLTSVGDLTSLTVNGTSNITGVATFGNNVTVTGDLTVNGTTTTVDSNIVSVDDPMFRLADNNPANSLDIGFYGMYQDPIGVTKFTGLIKDASADKFFLFDGAQTEPGTETATITEAYFTFDTANQRLGVGLGITAPSKSIDATGSALLRGGELCLVDADDKIASDGSEMTFTVGASERMVIASSGNVGIGTTDPDEALEVNGNLKFNGASDQILNDDASLRLSKTTLGSSVTASSLTSVGTLTSLLVSGASGFGGATTPSYDITIGDDNTGINGDAEDVLAIYTGGLERMTIYSDGNVGIGSDVPTKKLDVNGSALFQGGELCMVDANNKIATATNAMRFTTNSVERMVIDASGDIGIGTNAPDTDVHIEKSQSGANVGLKLENISDTANSDAVLQLAVGGTSGGDPHIEMAVPSGSTWSLGIDNSAANDFAIGLGAVGSDPKLTIATGGNVGIGSADPTQLLDVAGIANITDKIAVGAAFTPDYDVSIGDANTGFNQEGEDILATYTSGSERMRIDASGNVGIGTNSVAADLHLQKSTAGDVALHIVNSNTSSTADSKLLIQSSSSTGGDPHIELATDANNWSIGVDNDETDLFRIGLGAVGANELLVIETGGNVGIGSSNPGNKLSVCDGAASRGLADVVIEGNVSASQHTFMLLEARNSTYDAGIMLYTDAGSDPKHAAIYMDSSYSTDGLLRFATGAAVATDANRATATKMTIDNANGNVMIGSAATSSTLGKLYINGTGDASVVSFGYLNSSGTTGTQTSQSNSYSIWATGQIRATEFHAMSDIRTKKNINESNYQSDLELLAGLKTYEYEYIDQKFEKKEARRGVIAQEIEEVIPQVVSKCSDFIPNIYKVGSVSSNGKEIAVEFDMENDDIKVGSTVKLMIYKVENDQGETAEFEIESISENKLVLKEAIDLSIFYDELFVIGTRVEDFRNVSNDDILFISVGAIKQLKQENDQLKEQISDILSRLAALENKQ